jgi:hypothetical protein
MLTINDLVIKALLATPVGGEQLAPWDVLFSPLHKSPPASSTPDLGIQIGWPILAGVLLGVLALLRRRSPRPARPQLVIALASFALAMALVMMNSAGWQYVPEIFYVVQSSYRLLMFVVLWGALLAGFGLAGWLGEMRPWQFACALGLIAISCISYFPHHARLGPQALRELIENPDLGGSGARSNYLLSLAASARDATPHPDVNYADPSYELIPDGWLSLNQIGEPRATFVPSGAVQAGGKLIIEGVAPTEAGELSLAVLLEGVTLPQKKLAPAQPFHLEFPFERSLPPGAGIRLRLVCDRYPVDGGRALRVDRIHFIEPQPPDRHLVPAGAIARNVKYGRRSTAIVETAAPALVQLPVLYYPHGLVRAWEGTRELKPHNVGRLLAVPLDAGRHRLRITFAGIGWANWLSALAWAGVAGVALASLRRRRRRKRREASPDFSVARALLTFIVPGVVFCAIPIWRQVQIHLQRGMPVQVKASHSQNETFAAEYAFDHDPATSWAAPGGVAEVTLSIVPERPARCVKAVFEARITALYETWQNVRAEFYRGGLKVSEQSFVLENAATQPTTEVHFQPVPADRIELHFSSPVCVTRDGKTRVPPAATAPGYREIHLTWEP